MKALNIAATGMHAQELNVEVISHNLANMTTSGYKRQRPEFQDLLYQSQRRVGTNAADNGNIVPTGVQLGLGVKTGGIYRNNEQGTLQNTSNALDIAIKGKGFLRVTLPSGEFAYTRDGALQISPEGEIVTVDGHLVSPGITIPQGSTGVSINDSGEIEVKIDGQVEPQNLGQLELVTFINDNGLEALGNNLFMETAASGDPVAGIPGEEGFGSIMQGFLENSNVDPISEITALITAQRAYDLNSKVITASDQMLQSLNQSA